MHSNLSFQGMIVLLFEKLNGHDRHHSQIYSKDQRVIKTQV